VTRWGSPNGTGLENGRAARRFGTARTALGIAVDDPAVAARAPSPQRLPPHRTLLTDQTLAEGLNGTNRESVEWKGKLVYGIYDLPSRVSTFDIEVHAQSRHYAHALSIASKGGHLELDGDRHECFNLWGKRRKPARYTVRVIPNGKREDCSVWVWNSWRSGVGNVNA
jgi:hypothetical protein